MRLRHDQVIREDRGIEGIERILRKKKKVKKEVRERKGKNK